jgi:hypothetical protein
MNEMEIKRTKQKINEAKSRFFKIIHKIVKSCSLEDPN